jgi:hypothetical protein
MARIIGYLGYEDDRKSGIIGWLEIIYAEKQDKQTF